MKISHQDVVRFRRLAALASTRLKDAEGRAAEIVHAISIAHAEMSQVDALFDSTIVDCDSHIQPLVMAAASRRRRALQGIMARLERARIGIASECAALRAQHDLQLERCILAERRYGEHQEQVEISEFVEGQLCNVIFRQVRLANDVSGVCRVKQLDAMAREAGETDQ